MNAKLSAVATLVLGLSGIGGAAQAAQYANVISSTPVTASVGVPRQDCVQGERIVRQAPSGAGALLGAIAGGVIGNQFGHGAGRAATTGLGVVAGSAIGNNVEANGYDATAVPVQRCRTVSAYESRTVGYDVVYEYNGQRYNTRLPRDPGPRLAIAVQPQPGYGPDVSYSDPAPTYDGPVPLGTPAYAGPVYRVPPAATYYDVAPVYYEPAAAYYEPAYYEPAYYGPVVRPVISVGFGGYWGHGGGHRGRHWH